MELFRIWNSAIMSSIAKRLLEKILLKKLGITANVNVDDFAVSMTETQAIVNVTAQIAMPTDDVINLIKL